MAQIWECQKTHLNVLAKRHYCRKRWRNKYIWISIITNFNLLVYDDVSPNVTLNFYLVSQMPATFICVTFRCCSSVHHGVFRFRCFLDKYRSRLLHSSQVIPHFRSSTKTNLGWLNNEMAPITNPHWRGGGGECVSLGLINLWFRKFGKNIRRISSVLYYTALYHCWYLIYLENE
jgi:hypothetical protein